MITGVHHASIFSQGQTPWTSDFSCGFVRCRSVLSNMVLPIMSDGSCNARHQFNSHSSLFHVSLSDPPFRACAQNISASDSSVDRVFSRHTVCVSNIPFKSSLEDQTFVFAVHCFIVGHCIDASFFCTSRSQLLSRRVSNTFLKAQLNGTHNTTIFLHSFNLLAVWKEDPLLFRFSSATNIFMSRIITLKFSSNTVDAIL